MPTALTTVTTFGGLQLAENAVQWSHSAGSAPSLGVVTFHKDVWAQAKGLFGTEQSLVAEYDGTEVFRIDGLTMLFEIPSSAPFLHSAQVADRRWRWRYRLVLCDYNMTRRTGDKMLTGVGEVPLEVQGNVDKFRFLDYSLDAKYGNVRWTTRRVIEDVLDRVEGKNAYRIDGVGTRADGAFGKATIQNFMLRDNGDQAVSRVLGLAPGTEIKVEDNKVVVYDATDRAAATAQFNSLGYPLVGSNIVRNTDKAVLRAKKVRVYFQREVEFRFDFSEGATRYGGGTPELANVMQVPDRDIVIGGQHKYQGTWVPIDSYLAACGPSAFDAYDLATVRKHWFYGTLAEVWGGGGKDFALQATAANRASQVMHHYRQTFQIPADIMRRLRFIRSIRVAIWDTVTGTRAGAQAWSQYAILPSEKAVFLSDQFKAGNVRWAYNVDNYPGAANECSVKDASPVMVSIVDPELGIFRLDYSGGAHGLFSQIIPSQLCDSKTGLVRDPVRNLAFQESTAIFSCGHIEGVGEATLAPTFQCAVIITGLPAAPNNELGYHCEEVSMAEAAEVLPNIMGGMGQEILDLFVSPNEATARFAWKNTTEARATIPQLLGITGEKEFRSLPGWTFVNQNDEVRGVARALAAAAYSGWIDGLAGIHVAHAGTRPRMVGNVTGITEAVTPDGSRIVSTVHAPVSPPIDHMTLLSDEARRIVLKILPDAP